MVEFALVAPVVMLMIGATVDMGRGLLLYTLLQGASRDTAAGGATEVCFFLAPARKRRKGWDY